MNINPIVLKRINSATKYPSIDTYHAMDSNGVLTDETRVDFGECSVLHVHEKVDGVNSRIIFLPGGEFIIGSRNEFLHFSDDVIYNPASGIVEALKPFARHMSEKIHVDENNIIVLYMEVYGKCATPAWKQYSDDANFVGHVLIDMKVIELVDVLMNIDSDVLSSMRENGKIPGWKSSLSIDDFCLAGHVERAPWTAKIDSLPTTHEGCLRFLHEMVPNTMVGEKENGKSEGVIVRDIGRNNIAKLRFKDYERAVKRKNRTTLIKPKQREKE